MLGAHSRISTVSEPWLLLHYLYITKSYGLFAEYNQSHCHTAFENFIAEMPGGEEDFFKDLRQFVILQYQRVSDPSAVYFLDKTPRYYLIIPEIARMFPDAKFIFLFRNPLQILSSFIKTWYKGNLLLHGTHMDLFRGFKLLARGYRMLGHKSINVEFESLVSNTQNELKRIFQYLELDMESGCLDRFSKVAYSGDLGDRTGSQEYDKVSSKPVEKWKTGIDTMVKKKFAKRLLNHIGSENLNTLGYSLADLQYELSRLNVSRFGITDLFCLTLSKLIRTFEPFIFIQKIKQKKQTGQMFELHR